jgi:hypothetical protein
VHDLFAVVSTETAQEWASAACTRSRELCQWAEAEVRRARRFRVERGHQGDPPVDAMRARLVAAELYAKNLERAQRSNRRIGMAIGILMSRHGVTEIQAFEALRSVSTHRNVRLREIAEDVVYTGDLPGMSAVGPVGTRVARPSPSGRARSRA